MSDIGFTCDVCGRKVQCTTYVNGMMFCAKCYQDTFGNNYSQTDIINAQYTEKLLKENAQLKKENEELKLQLEKKDNKIKSLKKQLARFNKFMEINEWSSIQEMQDTLNACEQKYSEQQHQLAEKDTFIKELQNDNRELRKGLNKSGLDYFISSSNSIRHQVCDEVREYCKNNFIPIPNKLGCYVEVNREEFFDNLDQIEKGETK